MVAVAHIVAVARLNQLHRRQRIPAPTSNGDTDPAIAGVVVQRIKHAVEVTDAPLATDDLRQGDVDNGRLARRPAGRVGVRRGQMTEMALPAQ